MKVNTAATRIREPRDPASLLMKYFGTVQVKTRSKFVMNDRNKARMAKLLARVQKMRGIHASQ